MDACSTGQLGQTTNSVLHIPWCNHHKVCKLIYDNDDLTHFLRALLSLRELHLLNLAVKLFQISYPILCKSIVSVTHLGNGPVQCACSFLRICDNRNEQMRDTIINTKLYHFRVNHDQLNLVWLGFI